MKIQSRLMGTIACVVALATATSAHAGGYDTPMLYSARHMGMGGAAAGYVYDGSAMFHNPAGLGHIKKLSLLGNFTLLVGNIRASPNAGAVDQDSDPVIAPFPMLAGGYRILDWLVVGGAVFPVASASGSYKYQSGGANVDDSTTLLFIEGGIGAAANFDSIGLRIGAGYRLTYVSLARQQSRDGTDQINLDLSGINPASFRVGVQWDAIKNYLQLGFSYRHKASTNLTADQVTIPALFGGTATDAEAEFVLPGRLIWGVRGDYANFGLAVDLEYSLNSQNNVTVLRGQTATGEIALNNVFQWRNAITLRAGLEYSIRVGGTDKEPWMLAPRLGFVFDDATSTKKYPTAFGTPPAPTYVITGGLGLRKGPYNINLAYAYRFGTTTITQADTMLEQGDPLCSFCGAPGNYGIFLNGMFIDFSYDFDL